MGCPDSLHRDDRVDKGSDSPKEIEGASEEMAIPCCGTGECFDAKSIG